MPDFCCKMLGERGDIVSSADITATNLEAAIGTPLLFFTRATSPGHPGGYILSKSGPVQVGCFPRSWTWTCVS